MNSEQDLLQKLIISKKIMDRHNTIGRGSVDESRLMNPQLENFNAVEGKYNIPEEFISESTQRPQTNEIPAKDRILNSKLPDEIKQLMIEHPIQQPKMGMGTDAVLSNDLVEKASRLMNTKANGELMSENKKPNRTQPVSSDMKSMIREVIEDVLRENGLITESESKSNEVFKFRVGNHLFEGKLTKVKKISK